LPDAEATLQALKSCTSMLVLDIYHSFLARPLSLKNLQDDIYVVGGAYKYLQAGEGACFLYTPPKAEKLRPQFTGWYAHFESLEAPPQAQVEYGKGAWRFWGSTFDPTPLYRLQAVLRFFKAQGLSDHVIHEHSLTLQERCLEILRDLKRQAEWQKLLTEAARHVLPASERGNFLSFPLKGGEARKIQQELAGQKILCDSRESQQQSYLRFGFGLYHELADLDRLQS
jgi:kynureninase